MNLLTLFADTSGGGSTFDPLTYDANTIALWDGDDAGDGDSNWVDQVGPYTLDYGRSSASVAWPALNVGGLNGHNYVQFTYAGPYTNYANVVTPVRSQPTTQYLVVGNNEHLGNRYLMDDGVVATRNKLACVNPSPNIVYTNVAAGVTGITSFSLTAFHIVTIVKAVGADASSITIDEGTPETFTMDGAGVDDAGFTLNNPTGLAAYSGVKSKWAYIIVRDGADSEATRAEFVGFLKTRFGL